MRDADVNDVLRRVLPFLDENCFAVIRCADSTADYRGLQRILAYHGIDHRVVCDNVCIHLSKIKEVIDKLFTGFDEVWFMSKDELPQEMSTLSVYTSDGSEFHDKLPDEVVKAINRTDCELVLADGCGLNFATPHSEIADAIRALEHE